MASQTTHYLILPGWQGSPDDHWQSHWQRSLPNASRVEQTDWFNPDPHSWVAALERHVAAARGSLVLVAHGAGAPQVEIGKDLDLNGLLADGKLSMAMVDSVPAGQYGKAALESLGLWKGVAPSVAQAENVRDALKLVALGEAPLGIVYASDAVAEPGVSVVGTFPPDSHPAIAYPVALLTGAADQADRDFLKALSEPAADAIFAAQGFKVMK